MLMAGLRQFPCYADEITFADQKGVQVGTVIEKDEHTVTVRFPRKSIQSIARDRKRLSSTGKTQDSGSVSTTPELQKKIERLQKRIERLEKNLHKGKKSNSSPTPDTPKNVANIKQLLREGVGRMEGVILWKRRPLANKSVIIVLERYAGSSLASIKKIYRENKKKSRDKKIIIKTKTDSKGRYIFKKVPPGQYRLYWKPDSKTGWVHRMREKSDFEITAGELVIQNIPEKK